MGSYYIPIETYSLSLTGFELLNCLQKRFTPVCRQFDGLFDPDTMAVTALEAIASTGDKN